MSSSSAGAVDASTADPKLQAESTLGLQIGIVSVLYITALTITILRMYSRIFLAKAFGWDDGFMVGATVSDQPTPTLNTEVCPRDRELIII